MEDGHDGHDSNDVNDNNGRHDNDDYKSKSSLRHAPATLHNTRMRGVWWLEADAGQPDMGTPGVLSLTRVDRPLWAYGQQPQPTWYVFA